MDLPIRRLITLVDDRFELAGRPVDPPLRKVAVVAVVANPHVGRYVEDLSPLVEASRAIGVRMAEVAHRALGPYVAESYGKAGIVGLNGEQEHANALLTTTFANPFRDIIGGATAWISSMTKVAAPGAMIDIPMNAKTDVYVRSHYDGMSLVIPDAPLPDEIALVFCLANRGRPNARVGGMSYAGIDRSEDLDIQALRLNALEYFQQVPVMRVAIVNVGQIVSGDWRAPFATGDTIISEGSHIVYVGTAGGDALRGCDVVIDADGCVAIPGLIDSHVHITFGDYTPRQKTVGFLESYLHGGVTTAISASEVHVPGRPKDPVGIKALAVAARKSFEHYRPGGMRVHAGAVILEPGLTRADFKELRDAGVWLAKAGFGAFATPFDYKEQIDWAKDAGMITLVHTGGSSIPGSSGIWADHLLHLQPHVSFHTNGGPVAMPDRDYPRLLNESGMALQVCTAGNLRTTLLIGKLVTEADAFDRLLIATDTPTGSGIMPLGMLYTISHLASLGGIPAERAVAAATGNNARIYGLNSGVIAAGRDADIVLIDACAGGATTDALSALTNGDIAAVGAVISDGVPRFVGRSRNTPQTIKTVRVAENHVPFDFSAAAH